MKFTLVFNYNLYIFIDCILFAIILRESVTSFYIYFNATFFAVF